MIFKVSLYKKLLALLPAPEGCSKDEEGSLSTTEVFFSANKTIQSYKPSSVLVLWRKQSIRPLNVQVVNSLVDFKPKVEQASVENLLR